MEGLVDHIVGSDVVAIERQLSDFTRVFSQPDIEFLRHFHDSEIPNRYRMLSRIEEGRSGKALYALIIFLKLQSVDVSVGSGHHDHCLSEPLDLCNR